ncbi:MAG: hypothetical protein FIA94_11825 [Nitrospirae bacterium]|nr:hypothetical protein [Nitrospirota bacterium]
MILGNDKSERAEAYQTLSQFFLSPPDEEDLQVIRQDFSLESRESVAQIAEDYDFLFSYPHGYLQPIESIFSLSTETGYSNVAGVYARAGLALDESSDAVPDHLSIELLFMSYLIENEKTEQEKIFLEQHLMNWVPYYCGEIIKQAKTLFYREIAEIVKDFLISEYDLYAR